MELRTESEKKYSIYPEIRYAALVVAQWRILCYFVAFIILQINYVCTRNLNFINYFHA